jgi:hypothetical protein
VSNLRIGLEGDLECEHRVTAPVDEIGDLMPVDRVGDPVGDQGRYAEAVETL